MASIFENDDAFIGITDSQFESRIKKLTSKDKESLYLKSKDRYYSGDPILTDSQFDRLEQWLESEGSTVTQKVGGADGSRDKLVNPHLSPMLSLEKIQVNDEDNFPLADMQAWNVSGNYPLEATAKFDGNAIELQYVNGQLTMAVTRGENGKGGDVTKKVIAMGVPLTLPNNFKVVEIRGEVCMAMDVFKFRYQDDFKNARNLVAGILNPNNDDDPRASDCIFIAYSIKSHEDGNVHHIHSTMTSLTELGFNKDYPVKIEYVYDADDYRRVYDIFKHYRAVDSPFQLDGIVFKMNESKRALVGENRKSPKWAVALKFPAKEVTTKILDIIWEVGHTGELSPVGILEPVDLDGSEVTRVSLYNKTRIQENHTFPGALVTVRKAGDIIPQIVNIVQGSPDADEYIKNQNFYPSHCTTCGHETALEIHTATKAKADFKQTEHLMCNNSSCLGKLSRRLNLGINALNIKGIGEATCESLINAGISDITEIFDGSKFNTQYLCASGVFKPGRALEVILNAVKKFKQVDADKVILALQFEGVGDTTAKAVANQLFEGIKDFEGLGLEKSVVDPFLDPSSDKSLAVKNFMSVLKDAGVDIVPPKKLSVGSIVFEMTGSPSGAGYTTKEEFVDFVARHGYVHGKMKNASMLVTDSYTSKTSKMTDAAKKNLTVITYEDLVNKL